MLSHDSSGQPPLEEVLAVDAAVMLPRARSRAAIITRSSASCCARLADTDAAYSSAWWIAASPDGTCVCCTLVAWAMNVGCACATNVGVTFAVPKFTPPLNVPNEAPVVGIGESITVCVWTAGAWPQAGRLNRLHRGCRHGVRHDGAASWYTISGGGTLTTIRG